MTYFLAFWIFVALPIMTVLSALDTDPSAIPLWKEIAFVGIVPMSSFVFYFAWWPCYKCYFEPPQGGSE